MTKIERFILQKAATKLVVEDSHPTQDEWGVLTKFGMSVCATYARKWLGGARDADTERSYPDLVSAFYDIRHDAAYAAQHAS